MKTIILLFTFFLFALLFASCAKEEQPVPEEHPYAFIDYTLEQCIDCGDQIKVMYIYRPDGELVKLYRNTVKDVGYTGYVKRVIVCTGSFKDGITIEIGAEGEHVYDISNYDALDLFIRTL